MDTRFSLGDTVSTIICGSNSRNYDYIVKGFVNYTLHYSTNNGRITYDESRYELHSTGRIMYDGTRFKTTRIVLTEKTTKYTFWDLSGQ